MARKDRSIASFDEVANINDKDNTNNDDVKSEKNNRNISGQIDDNNNDDINNKVNININEEDNKKDFIDVLVEENVKKEKTQVLKGFYLDKDVARVIDKLAKDGGKGIKSKIVNECLRKVFKEKGLL